jgi:hypothetical protein
MFKRRVQVTSTPENWVSAFSLIPISNHMVTAKIITRGIAKTSPTHVKKLVVIDERIKF